MQVVQSNYHPKFSLKTLVLFPKLTVIINGLFILPVKFMQNRQNKQQHFYSTGKIAHKLSKSIVGWNIHMARSPNQKILSRLCAQGEGVSLSAVQVMQ